jgi:iron complex transport system ATP-binding protein
MNAPCLLRSTGLTVGYGEPVVSDINLELGHGQFIALLGPNGAGKTTLLRTLSRHIKPLAGTIEILGRNANAISALDMARAVAVCLTDNAKPPLLSVSEFVALGRYPHTGFMGRLSAHDVEVVGQSLAAVAASDLAGRLVEQLSDGERQKVVLARALAQKPRLMLLDEPTAHLDLKHRIEVMGILRSLCRSHGLSVLASLHDIDVAAKVADRVLLVRDGRVTDYGLPEAVLTADKVAALYGFDDAKFDSRLGGIEFRGDGTAGRAFVIAGHGTGAPLFRLLSKKGLSIETGVLNEGDLDAYVAHALGASVHVQAARTDAPGQSLAMALDALHGCDFVVDGGADSADADALRACCAGSGLPLFRIAGTPSRAHGGVACLSLGELSAAIDALPAVRQKAAA